MKTLVLFLFLRTGQGEVDRWLTQIHLENKILRDAPWKAVVVIGSFDEFLLSSLVVFKLTSVACIDSSSWIDCRTTSLLICRINSARDGTKLLPHRGIGPRSFEPRLITEETSAYEAGRKILIYTWKPNYWSMQSKYTWKPSYLSMQSKYTWKPSYLSMQSKYTWKPSYSSMQSKYTWKPSYLSMQSKYTWKPSYLSMQSKYTWKPSYLSMQSKYTWKPSYSSMQSKYTWKPNYSSMQSEQNSMIRKIKRSLSLSWLDGAEVSHVGLRIGRSPVPVPPKTNFSIMFTLPVKSTGE